MTRLRSSQSTANRALASSATTTRGRSLRHRRWVAIGLVAGASLLGACGSSSPTTTTTTTTTTSTTTTTTTIRANQTSLITATWIAFFDGNTSAAGKIAALENGSQFAQIINGQASSAMAKSVHATVSKVSDITATSAKVRYSIYLGTSVALANQTGDAVYQGGQWKVSVSSFCVLLSLEGVSAPMCPKS